MAILHKKLNSLLHAEVAWNSRGIPHKYTPPTQPIGGSWEWCHHLTGKVPYTPRTLRTLAPYNSIVTVTEFTNWKWRGNIWANAPELLRLLLANFTRPYKHITSKFLCAQWEKYCRCGLHEDRRLKIVSFFRHFKRASKSTYPNFVVVQYLLRKPYKIKPV
jgi:hypothetical protein